MKNIKYEPLSKHKSISEEFSNHLDMFRWVSAYVVLLAHTYQIFVAPINSFFSESAAIVAQMGVMVFFVLSGFLISKSISKNISINRTFKLGVFVRARANRILSPFLFSMALACLLWLVAPKIFPSGDVNYLKTTHDIARLGFILDWLSFFGTLFFINEFITKTVLVNGPLWSLSFEIWYYIIAGWFFSANSKFNIAALMLIIIGLSILNYIFLVYFLVWLFGFSLAEFHNNEYKWDNFLYYIFAIAMCIQLLLVYFYIFPNSAFQVRGTIIIGAANCTFGFIFSIYLFFILRKIDKPFSLFVNFSKHSYSLYIYHFPVLLFVFGMFQTKALHSLSYALTFSAGALAVIICLSYLSGKYIETIKSFSKPNLDSNR